MLHRFKLKSTAADSINVVPAPAPYIPVPPSVEVPQAQEPKSSDSSLSSCSSGGEEQQNTVIAVATADNVNMNLNMNGTISQVPALSSNQVVPANVSIVSTNSTTATAMAVGIKRKAEHVTATPFVPATVPQEPKTVVVPSVVNIISGQPVPLPRWSAYIPVPIQPAPSKKARTVSVWNANEYSFLAPAPPPATPVAPTNTATANDTNNSVSHDVAQVPLSNSLPPLTFCLPATINASTSTSYERNQDTTTNSSCQANASNSETSQQETENENKIDTFQSCPLAAPGDDQVLSPIHCFVRKNIEIFAATPEDVAAPAPGRKIKVSVGQIGIRCIHCKHLSSKSKKRVKRAICYPPTILSIYHSVSNMKFDHFGACQALTPSLRQEFASLRTLTSANSNPSKGGGGKAQNRKTTAQYYIDSAIQDLHLVDTNSGIRRKIPVPPTRPISPPKAGGEVAPTLDTSSSDVNASAASKFTYNSNTSQTTNNDQCPTAGGQEALDASPLQMSEKQPQMNGISVLMMVATDSAMREAYQEQKLIPLEGRIPPEYLSHLKNKFLI